MKQFFGILIILSGALFHCKSLAEEIDGYLLVRMALYKSDNYRLGDKIENVMTNKNLIAQPVLITRNDAHVEIGEEVSGYFEGVKLQINTKQLEDTISLVADFTLSETFSKGRGKSPTLHKVSNHSFGLSKNLLLMLSVDKQHYFVAVRADLFDSLAEADKQKSISYDFVNSKINQITMDKKL